MDRFAPTVRSSWEPTLFYALLGFLLALTWWTFSGRLAGGYVTVMDFQMVHRGLTQVIPEPWTLFSESHQGFGYRPLSDGLVAFWAWVGGGSPRAFLIANLAFHLLSTVLVVFLGAILLGSRMLGLIAAALYALHPTAVSMVGVPTFSGMLNSVMLGTVIAALKVSDLSAPQSRWLATVAVLGVAAPWVYEGLLWMVPFIIIILLFRFYREPTRWTVAVCASLVLLSLIVYFVARHNAIEFSSALATSSAESTYGLKNFAQIIKNVALHQYGSSMIYDHLANIDPLRESIDRGLDATVLHLFGLSLASALACCVIVYGLTGLGLARERGLGGGWAGPLVALFLFWTSISVQMLFALGSEFYLYISRPFWSIALVGAVALTISRFPRFKTALAKVAMTALAIVMAISVHQVQGRIDALNEKSRVIESQTQALRDFVERTNRPVTVVVSCRIPFGFSVYGMNRSAWVQARQWRELALGEHTSRVRFMRADKAIGLSSGAADGEVLALIDSNGRFKSDDNAVREELTACNSPGQAG